ncbi:exo-rhamnogalacturonan lyase family protein [Caldanaerobius polysaccharolyticus]|uniref:exo-rhamnogalacturonan lyase family protein n=1 Tax=Caldanaerobius polysaccharolyticus TaxID=44256 RepID=UPI001FDEAEC7|nr:hypothetical protein [Caldanaerobius polysaccharolyticus]
MVIHWLGNKRPKKGGVTWGIPWKRGALTRDELVKIEGENGEDITVQSWITAYWPDGSVKWTAHAASFSDTPPQRLYAYKTVGPGPLVSPDVDGFMSVEQTDDCIDVDTGMITCRISKKGSDIIKYIRRGDVTVCTGAKLVCIRESRSIASGLRVRAEEDFESQIVESEIESQGPRRCVIRIRGRHINKGNAATGIYRGWLPFDMRLYFYAGQESIRFVYTFFYDGNPYADFIKGIGMTFSVPMAGPLYNRYVRFSGDSGLFCESPKNLMNKMTYGKYEDLYRMQIEGKPVSLDPEQDSRFLAMVDDSAVWDCFKLVQYSSDNYAIFKRTNEHCSFVEATRGNRSGGLACVGHEKGGVAVGVEDFWQKYPSSLETLGVVSDIARLTLWFWPPDCEAMDLRHYDTSTHVLSSYEGFDELRSTPYGIANTSEFALYCFDGMPGNHMLVEIAAECASPPLLVCEPEYYRKTGVFGEWSLVDRSTPQRAFIEDQLDALVKFYKGEIERRKWYGFWNYGDVMHSYDKVRHTWRYDIGGYAWQNTELVPNMWLWYMFLRSGREDVFRMAEAMTRHTSEVDVYHFGEYAGLGSRHNVLHWGCGCKEARISMAGLHRYYYYLTADERVGDVMDEVKEVDYTVGNLDPMRAYYPPDPRFKTHVRIGPDVMAFCSNWFTRWERYEDEVYKAKLFKCLDFLKSHPYALVSGGVYGYDPDKTQLHDFKLSGGDPFMFCFGSQFIWVEIAQAIGDSVLDNMIMDMGQFYSSFMEKKDEKLAEWGVPNRGFDMSVYSSGLAAYAASRRGIKGLAEEVWRTLLMDGEKSWVRLPVESEEVTSLITCVKPVTEIPWISTNAVSQWALNVIMSMGLIGDTVPKGIHELLKKRQSRLGGGASDR